MHAAGKSTALRGAKRQKVAEDIILTANGSAVNYRDMQKADNKEVKPLYVYRNCASEYRKRNDVSDSWLTNLHAAADACRATLPHTKLPGYVQICDVSKFNR